MMVSDWPPLFDSVTDMEELVVPTACKGKTSEVPDRVAVAGMKLRPLSWIVLLPVTVSSSKVSTAERFPVAPGVKMIPIKQLRPLWSGTVKLQLVVLGSMAKSPVLPDVKASWVKLSALLPTFETMIVWGAEEVMGACEAKFRYPIMPISRTTDVLVLPERPTWLVA